MIVCPTRMLLSIALLAALAATPSTVHAVPDSLATLTGRVRIVPGDVPGAFGNVIVIGERRGTMTNENGEFRIDLVRPGSRTLRVQLPGRAELLREIEVVPGRNAIPDLEVRGLPEPVRIAVGSRSAVAGNHLVASLRITGTMRVGDRLAVVPGIRNRGDSTVVLVRGVRSWYWRASPRTWIEVTGPDSGYVLPASSTTTTLSDGVGPNDFALVDPGETFDPRGGGWLDSSLRNGRFTRPGRYRATFNYDTTSRWATDWIGYECGECVVPADLTELLEQVPAVHLTATAEFEVLP